MDIQWHGLSCFTLKGKSGTIVTDPYDAKALGLKPLKLSSDIALANAENDLHNTVAALGGSVKVFDWPGEYEAKGVIVQGISAFDRPREKEGGKKDEAKRVIVYLIELDGFTICHLSNLGHKLTPEMLEVIGDVDILLIPVGGGAGTGGLDAKKAHEVIEQVDPRIVIPMYYKTPGMKLSLAELETFSKEVGLHAPEKEKIAKFQSPANLPQEKTEFKILEPTG